MGKTLGKTGVRYGTPHTEVGRAMRDDQARAAVMILEALERNHWVIYKAAQELGMRASMHQQGQLSQYIKRLGLRGIVHEKRWGDWVQNAVMRRENFTLHPMSVLDRLRAEACDEQAARALVASAIALHGGNVSKAARALNMSGARALTKCADQFGIKRLRYRRKR